MLPPFFKPAVKLVEDLFPDFVRYPTLEPDEASAFFRHRAKPGIHLILFAKEDALLARIGTEVQARVIWDYEERGRRFPNDEELRDEVEALRSLWVETIAEIYQPLSKEEQQFVEDFDD